MVARGHDVVFLERDMPWYAASRDMPEPPWGRTELYTDVADLRRRFRAEVAERSARYCPRSGERTDCHGLRPDAYQETGPDGYPIHRGVDGRLRAEAVLDVAPDTKPRSLNVSVTALSPTGKKVLFLEDALQVKPGTKEVKIPFTEVVRPDWEDGVWLVRFVVNNADAGGGQFWLAGDPEHYHFVVSGKPPQPSASKPGGRAPQPAKPAPPKAVRSPKPTKG